MRESYRRQVIFLEDDVTTAWADPARRAVEPPPRLGDIIDDKCGEHTTDRVSKAVGLSWATVDKMRRGVVTIAPTAMCVWARRPELARLDREADARRAAEQEAEAAERAIADAKRDEAKDARRGLHR